MAIVPRGPSIWRASTRAVSLRFRTPAAAGPERPYRSAATANSGTSASSWLRARRIAATVGSSADPQAAVAMKHGPDSWV